MPIKGSIRALFPGLRLKNMTVDSEGYFDAEDVILTKKTLFIDLDTEILTGEEFADGFTVKIKRIGTGLTENDFELDFGELSPEIFFYLENDAIYAEFTNEKNRFLIFQNISFEEVLQPANNTESPRALKEKELQAALDTDDYEAAARIRDELNLIPEEKPARSQRKAK